MLVVINADDTEIDRLLANAELEVAARVVAGYKEQIQRRDKFTKIYNRKANK